MNQEKVETALYQDGADTATIAKFFLYHKANLQVWQAFERYTMQAIKAGAKVGAKAIYERVRWESEIEKGQPFKANNNYCSYYARVFEVKHPEHKGFFEFRTIKGLK